MAKKKGKEPEAWYNVTAAGQSSDEAELYIYGNIGPSFWDDESVTAKQLIKDLNAVKGQSLVVRINSVGGAVADGIAIFNALRRHDADVRTEVDAVAYSVASLIAMAGNKIVMADNGLLMIHAPMSLASGNATEMRRMADVLDKYADAMISAYVRDAGPSKKDIESWLKDGDDHYFTATEAIELGLIDDMSESVDIAASLGGIDISKFTKPVAMAAAKPQPGATKMPKETQAAKPNAADKVKDYEESERIAAKVAASMSAAIIKGEPEQYTVEKAYADIKARNLELNNVFSMHLDRDGVQALKDQVISDPSITVDQARAMLLEEIGKGADPINQIGAQIASGADERDKRIEAMTAAMLSRVGVVAVDRSNPFRGMSLSDVARTSLENSGTNVRGMYVEEFAALALSPVRAAQTTSDFPVILENVIHKLVLTGFNSHVSTWDRTAKIGDVTDFREWNRLVPGLIGDLDEVDEHGAYRDKAIPDAEKNAIRATRKGNIISVTLETLVNDDTGGIQTMANGIGMAGSRAIERAFYSLIVANPTLSDGNALFSAAHGNLAAAGAAPSVATIDAARVEMATQTAPGDDAEFLDIRPVTGLCNTGIEGAFKSVLAAEYDDEATKNQRKPNTVQNLVQVVSSPRLGALPWYLFANPMEAPVVEVVFLNGQREPRVVMEENFRTSGMSWKVELPFGVGAIDYRGAYLNPGV